MPQPRYCPCAFPIMKPLLRLLLLGHQVPQRQIIHDVLDVLNPVLQSIATAAQTVVLEVENLEACVQVLDELVDQQRTLVVAEGDGIASETGLISFLVTL